MRAYEIDPGQESASLRVVERDRPTPGPRQILVRMRAASLNYRDLLVSRGIYGPGMGKGLVPLSDGAGEVAAIGAEVTRFAVGDRVCPAFFASWFGGAIRPSDMPSALGGYIDGVLAEYVVCDERAAAMLPDHLSFEQGACLPCAGLTAWNALNGPAPVVAGQTVLTLGTGGVSVFAIQFASAMGARIISTSSSDDKLARARALGAHDTINYADHPDWEQRVLELTDGRGADHVVEIGGGGTMPKSIASCAVGGWVHLIGVLTGGAVDPTPLIQWRSLRGIFVGSCEQLEAMNRAIAVNGIQPEVDTAFAFDDARAAYDRLESAGHVGKVVIRIGD